VFPDTEWRLSRLLEEAVADLKAHNNSGISAVLEPLSSTASEMRFFRVEVAHLRSLTGSISGVDCRG